MLYVELKIGKERFNHFDFSMVMGQIFYESSGLYSIVVKAYGS